MNIDLSELAYPWLESAQAALRRMLAAGRMPHGLLIQAAAGLGAEQLAQWTAALVMCGDASNAPCGQCKSCRLLTAGTHPDFSWTARIEDAKQLQVDQIRALIEVLALKSHGGGYKVAVIAEADFMNTNAANALLKTLEEPPSATLLILCSARASRLPATVISRCQRLKVAAPSRTQALGWLAGRGTNQPWARVLDHAGGAPLRAMELAGSGFAELDAEMKGLVATLGKGSLDIAATAERWAKTDLGLRLSWLETWLCERVRAAQLTGPGLPAARGNTNIRTLYPLLDRVRVWKLEMNTSLNMQLAAEEWLLRAEMALAA